MSDNAKVTGQQSKATAGPWAIGLETDEESAQIITAEGWHLATVAHDPVMANARLIAAAPDLLAALEGLSGLLNDRPEDCYDADGGQTEELRQQLRTARAAIARARGEQA